MVINKLSSIKILNNQLILFHSDDHVAFVTDKVDTSYHSHNYIQITIGLEQDFYITREKDSFYTRGIILDSNISHKLHGYNEWQLYLLINPESIFGESIKRKFLHEKEVYLIGEEEINDIVKLNIQSTPEKSSLIEYNEFIEKFREILGLSNFYLDHTIDSRIQEILKYIETYPLDRLSVKELSNVIFLSESRLSHLFKEEIGISLTSYILHKKVERAFYLILNGMSITDAAIEAGFSSSSHFTNSVRDKLGMSPRIIIKNSRYMQV
ncbi:helix-turn-helix domain-containing protein [Tissierella carlieri]|uniref:helix-turn-helix domain-containing protein n=1 Tax=Tissierella carlieri TaxID=689904 RepID=UPI00386E4656